LLKGMNLTDVVTLGETMILLQPTQPLPLAYVANFVRSIGGSESNLAIALCRLGKKARWISRLGADTFGDLVERTLRGEGVDVSFVVRDAGAPTGLYFREYRAGEPLAHYYRRGSAASRLSPNDVQKEWLEDARHLHLTGITPALGEQTKAGVLKAMLLARSMGKTISFDPNLRHKLWSEAEARTTLIELIPRADLVLPGLGEAEFLLGKGSPEVLGRKLLELGAKIVVLKLGEAGAMLFTATQTLEAVGYKVDRVIDPIGAGDAFAAGFLSAWLDDADNLPKALRRGCILGALATQFNGDWEGLPTLAELEAIEAGQTEVIR
jgi:2-dehydro-3-deoxygluconokinase